MAIETERKFIMRNDWFDSDVYTNDAKHTAKAIEQFYFPDNSGVAIRVRIVNGTSAFLTIKGKKSQGSGSEFEYDIPAPDARQMIAEFCTIGIKKIRFNYEFMLRNYEVDVFQLETGNVFILAELEGDAEGEDAIFDVEIPHWAVKEVTDDHRFSNLSLAKNGFPED